MQPSQLEHQKNPAEMKKKRKTKKRFQGYNLSFCFEVQDIDRLHCKEVLSLPRLDFLFQSRKVMASPGPKLLQRPQGTSYSFKIHQRN